MTDFVWFYGPTAVGKDTLIHRIVEDTAHPLIETLGLEAPFHIHQDALDLRHDQRIDIVDKIADSRELGRTILIKTQGYDMDRLLPLELKQQLPNDRHLIVYLDADPSIIRERRIKRGQQPPTWDDVNDRNINLRLTLPVEAAGMEFIWLDNNGPKPVITTRPEH